MKRLIVSINARAVGPKSGFGSLHRQICEGEFDHLVGAAIHNGLDHVEAVEPLGHLRGNLRRDHELLPVHHRVDQYGTIVRKSIAEPKTPPSAASSNPDAANADRFRHGREIRVLELCSEVENPGRLLL